MRGTWRFVRRQRSWFRRDPRIHWLDAAAPPTWSTRHWRAALAYPGRMTGPCSALKGHGTENDFVRAARPRRGAVAVAGAGPGAVRPARRHRRRRRAAGGADQAGHRARRARPGRSGRVLHGLPQRRRLDRRDVRQRRAGVRPLPAAGRPDRRTGVAVATRGGPRAVTFDGADVTVEHGSRPPSGRNARVVGRPLVAGVGAGAAQPACGRRAGLGRRTRRAAT